MNILIMFDKYWTNYTTLEWRWAWRKAKFLQIASIVLVISFTMGPSKIRHRRLTTQTRISDYIYRIPIIFRAVQLFRRFVPNFAHVASLLNQKLRGGQVQTCNGLTKNIIALQTVKAKLVEPLVVALPCWLDDCTWDTDACGKYIAVSCYRTSLREQANQLDIGPVR